MGREREGRGSEEALNKSRGREGERMGGDEGEVVVSQCLLPGPRAVPPRRPTVARRSGLDQQQTPLSAV